MQGIECATEPELCERRKCTVVESNPRTPAEKKEIIYFENGRAEGPVRRTLWAGAESYAAVNRALLEDFATAIRTGRAPKTTLTQALLVQRITDALYRSAERGEAVEISAM